MSFCSEDKGAGWCSAFSILGSLSIIMFVLTVFPYAVLSMLPLHKIRGEIYQSQANTILHFHNPDTKYLLISHDFRDLSSQHYLRLSISLDGVLAHVILHQSFLLLYTRNVPAASRSIPSQPYRQAVSRLQRRVFNRICGLCNSRDVQR